MGGRTTSRIARLGLAWICAIAIGLISGEVATRLTGVIDGVSIIPRRLLIGTDDPLLPYRLRPGARLEQMGVLVRVNRFGLRGAEIVRGPGGEARRILVLGDSVAYGWGLEEADTFPVLLGEEPRRQGLRVEVLNAGVPGYNTESAVALLRRMGPSLAPDALVLGVSLNDFEETPRLSPLGLLLAGEASADESWLAAHSEFYFLLRWAAPALLKQRWQSPAGSEAGSERDERVRKFLRRQAIARRERFYAAPSGPGWERIRRSLGELRDLAASSGSELAVVVFPEEDQLESARSELKPQLRWQQLCAQLELSCLDLWNAFAGAAGEEPLFRDLQHPNALGMRVAASATAEYLAR
jgi:lysophospholipase L1-like esterase